MLEELKKELDEELQEQEEQLILLESQDEPEEVENQYIELGISENDFH